METAILSSPTGENFANPTESDRFYRLTTAELVHFCEAKYAPSVVKVYYYIKTVDPFGNGFPLIPKQIAKILKYDHRTVSRAIKVLVKAGELGLAIVEAHVKLVAKSIESATEIVSQLGLGKQPAPPAPEPPISVPIVEMVSEPISVVPTAPQPQPSQPTKTTPRSNSGADSIGNIIANMGFPETSNPQPFPPESPADTDSTIKTPQWFDRVEFRLNAMDIKLADVLHALKKYPVQAIEDAIAYTQKQNWSKAKAGVFVNYLKKWTPTTGAVKGKSKSASEPVKTALMERFPDIANTLAQERNPIDEATLDYLQRLKVAGGIYDMQYSSIHNFFGVFITVKDYPHLIPWWDAVPQLQRLYPACA
jgi:DNA-binding MarR family transcriptional regulator